MSNRKPPRLGTSVFRNVTPVIDWAALPDGALLLVDSAPLIYHLEDNARLAHRFAGLFEAATAGRLAIAISTITMAEVLTGPHKHGRVALARQMVAALIEHTICPLSASIAIESARLRVRYRLRLPDAIQLATALEINAFALVTHDRDFSSVRDIRVLM